MAVKKTEFDDLRARQITYIPSPTVAHFYSDFETEFCAIMSPVGLGKTSALILKALRIAKRQCPDENGVRYTRQAFARGTYQQLMDSTVKSFKEWIPPSVCKLRESAPIAGTIDMLPLNDQEALFPPNSILGGQYNAETGIREGGEDVSGKRVGDYFPNGTYMHAEFRFLGLDSQNAISDLRSTEWTCINLDEPDQMDNLEDVLTEAQTRVGRYPSAQTASLTCSQINMAYNPPAYKSFLERYFRKENEQFSRKLYRIPSPLIATFDKEDPDNWYKATFTKNPDAEGVHVQNKGLKYWMDIVDANRHDPDKITRLVLGDFSYGQGGRPIHPNFSASKHLVSESKMPKPRRGAKIIASMDWGRRPACVFIQFFDGKLHIFSELTSVDTPVHEFVREDFITTVRSRYAGYDVIVTGDPSGSYGRDTGETPFSIVAQAGFNIMPHTSQDPERRWAAVNYFINRDMILVSDECENVAAAFLGGYQWVKQKGGKIVRKAEKNEYSDPQDALQAGCLYIQGGHDTLAMANDVYGFGGSESPKQETNYLFW